MKLKNLFKTVSSPKIHTINDAKSGTQVLVKEGYEYADRLRAALAALATLNLTLINMTNNKTIENEEKPSLYPQPQIYNK